MRKLTDEERAAHDWLIDRAAALRQEAANLERAAAALAGRPWQAVPLAAVTDAPVDGYAPMDIRPEHVASPSVRKPSVRTASKRLIDATREHLRAGVTSVPVIAATVGVSGSHIRLAMRTLIAAGEVVRTGPRRGPGTSYRLATNGKEVVADASPGESLPRRHATAPAEIPPAAPPAPARDPVVPAAAVGPACEHCGGPRHPGSASLCRDCYSAKAKAPRALSETRTVAEVVESYETAAPAHATVASSDNSPGARVIDMLREAGAAGVPSRTLRVESGLEVGMFKSLMQSLIEAHKVEVELPAKRGGEKIYTIAS